MWGINVGRAIRRKNEEVFLVPPPQAYGFRGRYRTSSLALLRGMGRLSSRPPMAVVPFLLSAGEDDEYDLDPGVDFKYGLTPSLTLDLSWKTDFAQVESDQEQVNLTRFSLFFPEKRDFFLEGAGIFEFGERVEMQGLGGRPPTLLFYSRRIGIEEGHNVPVVAGGKLTGRAGPYQIGALRMTTRAGTFVDEEEDTLRVDRTDEHRPAPEVRPAGPLPTIGFIAIDKQPGSEAGYNRTAGADFTLSLLQAALKLSLALRPGPGSPGRKTATGPASWSWTTAGAASRPA